MKKSPTELIDELIEDLIPWQKEIFVKLRKIIHDADPKIAEDWKWDKPAFSHDGLVCWIWPFKNWVSFTFFQGSLIKDKYLLFNHGTFMDRNRTIAFKSVDEIDEAKLIEYITVAVSNNAKGMKVAAKSRNTGPLVIPSEIESELNKRSLMENFMERPPYQRRDYLSWIAQAKRAETKDKRLEQMLDELLTGDRYMNMAYEAKKK